MVIHYYSQNTIYIKNEPVIYLISDFIEGEKLSDFVDAQPKKRIHPYLALHFLYALIKGVVLVICFVKKHKAYIFFL
ncbi:hypothetical protein D6774_01145 [Candidatus Woesearchaeota archaeon]|nr:MAG: hypothetical protein D6774_01145 [Candidatus Woesearchaeota archaeon]